MTTVKEGQRMLIEMTAVKEAAKDKAEELERELAMAQLELTAVTDRAETEHMQAGREKEAFSIEMTASKEAAKAKAEELDGVMTAMMAQHAESLVLEQQRVADLQDEVAGLRELHALELKQMRGHFIGKIEELNSKQTGQLDSWLARQSPSR